MKKIFLSLALMFLAQTGFAQTEIVNHESNESENESALVVDEQSEAERGWTSWIRLGRTINSDPAACTVGIRTYVVARMSDNTIWYRIRNNNTGSWNSWRQVSTMVTNGHPAVACIYNSSTNYQVGVFLAHTNGNLYHFRNVNGSWVGSENLGGVVDYGSGPAAVGNAVGNRFEVIVRGTDQTFFRKYRYFGTWSNWERISSPMRSDPAIAMASTSRFDVFGLVPDFRLWSRMWEGNLWYPGVFHEGVLTSSPDATSRSLGDVWVFARGTSNQMLLKRQVQGVWGGWTSLGGTWSSGPGATTYANNSRIMVFVRGTDGVLWYRRWSP